MKTWSRALICLLVLALMLTACGKAPEPTPAPAAPTNTAAPPTPVPATPAPPTDTPVPALPETRQVNVTTLAFRGKASGAEGVAHTTTITIRHKDEPGLRVGFFDEEVEGTGPQWRASGWTAVTLASLLLGVNPEKFEFVFDVGGGWIDGPSAGALTTIGVLAALLGDTVREDAAMTGTINPDGTIGPVGGIPHKIDGAAKAGKKLVLIPTGQRYDFDENLQEQVDVVDVGRKLGVDVRMVANIYEAYEILTGKSLPRPEPSGLAEFPPRAFDKLRSSTKSWIGEYEDAVNRFNSLSEDARRDREPNYGYEMAQAADRALSEGMVAVAHQRAWEAAFDARTSLQAATLDEIYYQSGVDPLVDQLRATATSRQQLQAVFERLKAEESSTASEMIALMDAWSNLAVAWGHNVQGNDTVGQLNQQEDPDEDMVLDAIYQAAYNYVSAGVFLDITRDSLDFGMGFGKSPAAEDSRVTVMAELLRRAADANMALFEAVVVDEQAEQAQVSSDVMKAEFVDWDADYRSATLARYGQSVMQEELWEEPARSMMMLGASLTAWTESAISIAKYYSLGAQMDEDGNVIGITAERPLREMLDLSEKRAAELINLVREEEPVSALYYAENARIMRQGDSVSQLVALNYNWTAAVEAQMLAYFTGFYGEAVKDELERTGRPKELLNMWDLPAR